MPLIAQPSLSFDLKRVQGDGIYRQEDGRKHSSGFSGRRAEGPQRAGIQQMAFWLRFSAASTPPGKEIANPENYAAPSLSQRL